MYACLLPYREPLREVQVPEDFDAETLLDTIAVHCMNAFGQPVSESFGDTLAMVLRNALGSAEQTPSRRLSEDETQHVLGTALFASGGPTPGLVREIVREVETAKREGRKPKVPKDAEIPLRATAEEVARLHGKMENCHREDLIFAQLVACLEANSTPEDLVEGLQGQWLNVQNAIMPYVLPPEVSTAHLLLRSARRDTWTGDTLLAAQRVKWRFDRRARRQEKYFPSLELDAPAEIDGRQVDLHEIIPDASATIAPEGRLEEVLQAYGLTKQEQRVAVLRIWGYKQNEIARKMKVSAARVSQLMKAIGAKIGAQAGGDEKPRK